MSEVGGLVGGLCCIGITGTGAALLLCPGHPVEGDPRAGYSRQWQADMLAAPGAEPVWCIAGMFCAPCVQYKMRTWVLDNNMAEYKCCQGYFDTCCFKAGSCGDTGNPACLVVEACCCPGFAVQASRFYVMDTRNIMPSETDNKLAHFNNFLQILACLCRMFDLDQAELLTLVADVFFTTLMGCMSAQVAAELKAEASGKAARPTPGMAHAPTNLHIQRHDGGSLAGRPAASSVAHSSSVVLQPVAMGQPVAAQPFMVQVPLGVSPGEAMMVQSPVTGQMLQVTVPQNVAPGGQFQVMG